MISNVNSQSNAYVQQLAPKSENSKGVSQIQKSEELDKVSSLKEQINNGTYKVDLLKTSQAIMEELI